METNDEIDPATNRPSIPRPRQSAIRISIFQLTVLFLLLCIVAVCLFIASPKGNAAVPGDMITGSGWKDTQNVTAGTVVASYDLAPTDYKKAYFVQAWFLGRKYYGTGGTCTNCSYAYDVTAAFWTNDSGTLTLTQVAGSLSATKQSYHEDDSSADATIGKNGTSIEFKVNGVINQYIRWQVHYNIYELEHVGP